MHPVAVVTGIPERVEGGSNYIQTIMNIVVAIILLLIILVIVIVIIVLYKNNR